MVVGNKMAAFVSPWPIAEPAIVDTITTEETGDDENQAATPYCVQSTRKASLPAHPTS